MQAHLMFFADVKSTGDIDFDRKIYITCGLKFLFVCFLLSQDEIKKERKLQSLHLPFYITE